MIVSLLSNMARNCSKTDARASTNYTVGGDQNINIYVNGVQSVSTLCALVVAHLTFIPR